MHIDRLGAGQSIVFIHGSGCTSDIWRRQKKHLQASFEVVLVDLPGHGRSPGEGCGSVEQYGDAVYAALKAAGLSRPCIVGHSLGGAIAMYLALAHPGSVDGIVLVGTGARLKVIPRILEGILKEKERILADINALSFSKATPAAAKEEALGIMRGCAPEVIHGDFSACDRFDIMNSLDSIKMAALIICGEDDMLTPLKYSRFLNEGIQGSALVSIHGAGHMVMMEKPEEVNSAIRQFLEKS